MWGIGKTNGKWYLRAIPFSWPGLAEKWHSIFIISARSHLSLSKNSYCSAGGSMGHFPIIFYSWYSTGTSLQWRLTQGNIIKKRLMPFAPVKTHDHVTTSFGTLNIFFSETLIHQLNSDI